MIDWLRRYLATEAAAGMVMLFFATLALFAANSSVADSYTNLTNNEIYHGLTLRQIVSDIVMPFFFLMIGIELKHEMTDGALASRSQKILPLIAALGGIAAPALIYLAITRTHPELQPGWAIPTATDIAFAICIVNLIGHRVPNNAKIFLLAIAIYDDLAAILIIAFFYSSGFAPEPLAAATLGIIMLILLNKKQVRSPLPYLMIGIAIGYLLHEAGIHTTVAGMLVGLCLPHYSGERTMRWLHPITSFAILPLFALVNAGIPLQTITIDALTQPLPLAIIAGLFFGKPLGIFCATFLTIKLGIAAKPYGTSWRTLYAIATVAGIGFTMSLFIEQLAFPSVQAQQTATLGILVGSLLSAIIGAILLRRSL